MGESVLSKSIHRKLWTKLPLSMIWHHLATIGQTPAQIINSGQPLMHRHNRNSSSIWPENPGRMSKRDPKILGGPQHHHVLTPCREAVFRCPAKTIQALSPNPSHGKKGARLFQLRLSCDLLKIRMRLWFVYRVSAPSWVVIAGFQNHQQYSSTGEQLRTPKSWKILEDGSFPLTLSFSGDPLRFRPISGLIAAQKTFDHGNLCTPHPQPVPSKIHRPGSACPVINLSLCSIQTHAKNPKSKNQNPESKICTKRNAT